MFRMILSLLLLVTLALPGCGSSKERKSDRSASTTADAGTVATLDAHSGLPAGDDPALAPATTPSAAPAAAPTQEVESCKRKKSKTEYLTSLTQDLFRRGPKASELKQFAAQDSDPTKVVAWAFQQEEYDTGVAYFVSNLLRIEQNLKVEANEKDLNEVALINDLKQEPVVLVQHNKNKPWSDLFTTRDIYCSARTAALYDFPVDKNIAGFVSCKMPAERAGLLGMVSVLRAFKSAYYVSNSNRHRVAMSLYLAQGLQLAARTNGPVGEGRPAPLAACVPEIDTRVSDTGLVFGTAAVPKAGPICAGCHSQFLAPMEPAFLRFGMKPRQQNLWVTSGSGNLPRL